MLADGDGMSSTFDLLPLSVRRSATFDRFGGCCRRICSLPRSPSAASAWGGGCDGSHSGRNRGRGGGAGGSYKPRLVELRVRLVTGEDVDLRVSPEETVLMLKLRLERDQGIPASSLRLLLGGDRELEDGERAQGLRSGGILLLKVLPGGRRASLDMNLVEAARLQIEANDISAAAPINAASARSCGESCGTPSPNGLVGWGATTDDLSRSPFRDSGWHDFGLPREGTESSKQTAELSRKPSWWRRLRSCSATALHGHR